MHDFQTSDLDQTKDSFKNKKKVDRISVLRNNTQSLIQNKNKVQFKASNLSFHEQTDEPNNNSQQAFIKSNTSSNNAKESSIKKPEDYLIFS